MTPRTGFAGATPGGACCPGRRHRHVHDLRIRRPPDAPRAQVAADLFHVVQLAVKTVGDVRRRAIRERYGRRGKAGDPKYGIKHVAEARTWENLFPDNFEEDNRHARIQRRRTQIGITLDREGRFRELAEAPARVTGSTPANGKCRTSSSFYDWCTQHEDFPRAPDASRAPSTLGKRDRHRRCHGVTNTTAESLNRLAKLEARHAYGFRNPANQRRRVRIACTRGTRRPPARTTSTAREVTNRKHHHG